MALAVALVVYGGMLVTAIRAGGLVSAAVGGAPAFAARSRVEDGRGWAAGYARGLCTGINQFYQWNTIRV
jgi:hypothetical protein